MSSLITRRGFQGRVLAVLLALLFLASPQAAPAAAPVADAQRFIEGLGEQTVAVLSRPGADQAQRFREMAGLLDQAADLELVARLVLGRHWRQASEAQRQEYKGLFRAYARDSLAQRFSAYKGGERFTVTGSRPVGEEDALVATQIILGEGQPTVSVDWRVRRADGRLVIIDVVAEGISLLVTNRSEFDSIVNRRGIDGLLAEMRSWHEGAGRAPGNA